MLTEMSVYVLMPTAYCTIYVLLPDICDLSSAISSVATRFYLVKPSFFFTILSLIVIQIRTKRFSFQV
jgi:hypothetical protein